MGFPPSISTVDPLLRYAGYTGWTYNVAQIASQQPATSQRADCLPIYLPNGTTITQVWVGITTAGSGTAPTGFYVFLVGVINGGASYKMVAQSTNQNASANLTSTGYKGFNLSSSYRTNTNDSTDGIYLVGILQNGAFGTTNVQFATNGPTGVIPGGSVGNVGTGLTQPVANGTSVTFQATTGGSGWFLAVL